MFTGIFFFCSGFGLIKSLDKKKDYLKGFIFKGEWWYYSTLLFVVGMYYCQYKDRIEKLFKKCYPVTLIASIILLIGSDLLAGFAAGKCGYTPTYSNVIMWKSSTLNLLADTFEATCFIMFLIVLTLKVKFNNPIISFLGKISFELYMTHNIFLFLFFNYFKINNQLKIIGLTYVCSIVFAFVVYLIDTGILRLIRVKKT